MTRKLTVLLLLILVILGGAPPSFARPQYLSNLTAVYGSGSCGTCHVIASGSGMRNFNGTFGQYNSNGTYAPRNPSGTLERRSSNRTDGQRNSNRTFPLNAYGMLFGRQSDHAADPGAALLAIGQPPSETAGPADTTESGTTAKATPGFEIALSLVGLFACASLAGRHNK